MFGLVRESRLRVSEHRVIALRIECASLEEKVLSLRSALDRSYQREEEQRAEAARLQAILIAHPIEPAEPAAKAPKAEESQPEPVRVLSALEVVQRATTHRNLHKVTK